MKDILLVFLTSVLYYDWDPHPIQPKASNSCGQIIEMNIHRE